MRNFLVCLLIICSSLFSNELPKNMNSVDVYSEYNYKYYNNAISSDLNTLLKYQFDKEKKQYGFVDILLFSLREASNEAKRLGFDHFNLYYSVDHKNKDVSIDEYLTNFDPNKINYVYPYNVGKKEGAGIGSILALGANIAMATVAVKGASSGSNVSSSSNVFANSVNGVMTDKSGQNIFKDAGGIIDNKVEADTLNKGVFYNVIEQSIWLTYDKNYDFKNPKIIKFSVQEVDKYFEKNPFRIKELYSTEKHLITRGLKDE